MKSSSTPPSKLFIRSEVLAVIEFLSVVDNPPKQDKAKQIKRLSRIEAQETVLEILVKELQRTDKPRELQAISELLMEIGTIETLQDPLWQIIRNPGMKDEIKDAANLVLHHLGDETDPDLYLEYLDDPQGLINRETERMLEVSASNPEAQIDFIDFIFSLPVSEQCNLIGSLQNDYQQEHLANLYIPALWAAPPYEVQELILKNLGKNRTQRAVQALHEALDHYADQPELLKVAKRSITELKLAGVFKEEEIEAARQAPAPPHPLVETSTVYENYATIPDGIGNQGLVFSRRQQNGDIAMMSVAINDIHGIIDCFGFYQLSESDFNRIIEKFHETSCKIPVPAAYCKERLVAAEALNVQQRFRIPYEYTCWKILLDDITDPPLDTFALCREWANPQWSDESTNLYQHPDFTTWFLERGDHPVMNDLLDAVQDTTLEAAANNTPPEELATTLNTYAESILLGLMKTSWRESMLTRLAHAAYLLQCLKTITFSKLAATEVVKLLAEDWETSGALQNGFIRQYGRRCVEEELLRLKQQHPETEALTKRVDYVLDQWDL